MKTLSVKTVRRTQLLDITREIEEYVTQSGVKSGLCHLYVPHTTAGIAINEHADPDVASDVEGIFNRLIPHNGQYRHAEGNTDSHMKAILSSTSQTCSLQTANLLLVPGRECFCASSTALVRAGCLLRSRLIPVRMFVIGVVTMQPNGYIC